MADLSGFDAREVEPPQRYSALPDGEYVVVIVGSEMRPTRAGNAEYLELVFEVIEGAYQGRRLWTRLNLGHPSPKAVAYARAELSAICRAVDVLTPRDSSELHDIPLVAKVVQRKRSDSDEVENVVRGYSRRKAAPRAEEPRGKLPW